MQHSGTEDYIRSDFLYQVYISHRNYNMELKLLSRGKTAFHPLPYGRGLPGGVVKKAELAELIESNCIAEFIRKTFKPKREGSLNDERQQSRF